MKLRGTVTAVCDEIEGMTFKYKDSETRERVTCLEDLAKGYGRRSHSTVVLKMTVSLTPHQEVRLLAESSAHYVGETANLRVPGKELGAGHGRGIGVLF